MLAPTRALFFGIPGFEVTGIPGLYSATGIKKSTGIPGLEVVVNARDVLVELLEKQLEDIKVNIGKLGNLLNYTLHSTPKLTPVYTHKH